MSWGNLYTVHYPLSLSTSVFDAKWGVFINGKHFVLFFPTITEVIMKFKSLFTTVSITIALIVLTVSSVYYVVDQGSAANIAGNLILLVCLFFFTWTALLLSKARQTNVAP